MGEITEKGREGEGNEKLRKGSKKREEGKDRKAKERKHKDND